MLDRCGSQSRRSFWHWAGKVIGGTAAILVWLACPDTALAQVTWTQITGSVRIQALLIDPATPTILYAGTDNGVFKSTDGGATWGAVNAGLANGFVRALALDHGNPTTLYAGTRDGVFKSTDAGMTWQAQSVGLTNRGVRSLAVDPATPTTLYAGTSGQAQFEPPDVLFKSVDGGATWESSSTRFPISVTGFRQGHRHRPHDADDALRGGRRYELAAWRGRLQERRRGGDVAV